MINIERGVVRVHGAVVGTPKSAGSVRTMVVPRDLVVPVRAHLATFVGNDPESLLFPGAAGGHLPPASFYADRYDPARGIAGRPDLRFHDLMHSAPTAFAQRPGATTRDVMAFGGHTTVAVVMRCQSTSTERQRQLLDADDEPSNVTKIDSPRGQPTRAITAGRTSRR